MSCIIPQYTFNLLTSIERLVEKRQNVAETMEIDSALPEVQKTTTEAMDVDVLKPKSGAGVQKQRQKKKPLRRNQRLRHEKGLKRAEAVNDQLAKKVGESETRGRTIKSRRVRIFVCH